MEKIIITGGYGFLGQCLWTRFVDTSRNLTRFRSKEYDLTQPDACEKLMLDEAPDTIIHLAARVGGIGANKENPGKFFYDNAIMGINLIEAARRHYVKKFVQVGTICSYPLLTTTPFRETDLWNGWPEDTNAPYGIAKKVLLVMLQAYRQQYNFNGIYLMPTNLYGPGDNFDLQSSHVIPALIRKMAAAKAKQENVVLWGSGHASREFLYVEDCAEAIALATEKYKKEYPINIGTGEEIRIKDLAKLIAKLIGYTGNIVWDVTKPDGQPSRRLDTKQAWLHFGFKATTRLEDGLQKTIDWFYKEKFKEC